MTKTKILTKILYLTIGSTLVVQWEDGRVWTHGTIEGKGNHNHHDRSYCIHITKTGRLVTWNRQHIKPTQISAEQYLHGQLYEHTKTDALENILTQPEKWPAANNISNNIYNGPYRNNTTHEHPTVHKEQENNKGECKENNEQK